MNSTDHEIALQQEVDDERFTSKMMEVYETIVQMLTKQNNDYDKKFHDMKLVIQDLLKENSHLSTELKSSLENHIKKVEDESSEPVFENATVAELREQLILANEEKVNVQEMWQHALAEIDRLEEQLQQLEQHPNEAAFVLQEQLAEAKTSYNKVIASLTASINNLQEDYRRTKVEVEEKNTKICELHSLLNTTKEHLLTKDQDNVALQYKEKVLKSSSQTLQDELFAAKQKIIMMTKDLSDVRENNFYLQQEVKELTDKLQPVEKKLQSALVQVKESVQMCEDALLEKDQALLKLKHSEAEVIRLQNALVKLLDEAGSRTKQEVDQVKNIYLEQVKQKADEIQKLQQANSELIAEVKHVKSMCNTTVTQDDIYPSFKKDDLHFAYSELQLKLSASEARSMDLLRQLEMFKINLKSSERNYEEDTKQWKKERQRFKEDLKKLEVASETVMNTNLSLIDKVRKLEQKCMEFQLQFDLEQKKFMKKVNFMDEQKQLSEKTWVSKLDNVEKNHRQTCDNLKQQLLELQKLNTRLKLESKKLKQSFSANSGDLQTEILRYKSRTEELTNLLKKYNSASCS